MRWAEGFIAVDWGTTNRRAYLIDSEGRCASEFEDDKGLLSLRREQFGAAVADIRDRLGDQPMLLAGMVGSNRGWVEAPYVRCPAGLDDLAANLAWPEEGRTAIVPGVAYEDERWDVMRGEEIQIFGAIASDSIPNDCLVCHPGTHNKWVEVAGGRIESFRTVMTGELFNLLRDRSILSDLLSKPAVIDPAFCDGVRTGFSGKGVTAELFEVRARYLLGVLDKSDGASFVSGLLIGEDIRIGLGDRAAERVVVMGRPELTSLYSAALSECGTEAEEIDGEGAFIAGAQSIVERLQ